MMEKSNEILCRTFNGEAKTVLEVIFPALDKCVTNATQNEHMGKHNFFIIFLSCKVFHFLIDESFPKELASYAGALQMSVSQYMAWGKATMEMMYMHYLAIEPVGPIWISP